MKGVNDNLGLHSAGPVGILTLGGRYLGEEAESAFSRRMGLILQIFASGGGTVVNYYAKNPRLIIYHVPEERSRHLVDGNRGVSCFTQHRCKISNWFEIWTHKIVAAVDDADRAPDLEGRDEKLQSHQKKTKR